MRSTAFTFLLALVALLVCSLAGWNLSRGNLDDLLGARLVPTGQRLYQNFKPEEVFRIELGGGEEPVAAVKTPEGWMLESPWKDRMDPRAAVSIIHFTLGLRVEDSADVDEIDRREVGLRENTISIRLLDAEGNHLARYYLGRRTPWLAEFEDEPQPVPTVYIRTRDANRKDHVYICTGDITPLFKDGMKFLRDHRPFYFNPMTLQKIRIRGEQGELSLARETPSHPWRIVKPLDLPTDPAAVKSLLEKLYELQAVGIAERDSITLPANGSSAKTRQIALTGFGEKGEVTLEILSPESPESRDVPAVIGDRPGAVFFLPMRPEADLISLADLPLTVNELRDATLTNLNIASLAAISIRPATGAEIVVFRDKGKPWLVRLDGRDHLANEQRLFALLKAVTAERAIGFETDAATDFSPWGLDQPILELRFLGDNEQVLGLKFGLDDKGDIFVNRTGTSTVMRVNPALLSAISVRPYEWRHARLWSLSKVDLRAIVRQTGNEAPLLLRYDDTVQSWQAGQAGKDLTPELIQTRANFMLDHMEGLEIQRWLAVDDPDAASALASPSLRFEIVENEVDEMGDLTGLKRKELRLAPTTMSGLYFGRMSAEPNPFLIDSANYQKLSLDLLERQ